MSLNQFMLPCQKHLFNLPNDLTYLNCSYMSPLLRSVSEAGVEAIYKKENPTSLEPHHFFSYSERARIAFAKLINAPDPSRCAIIPSVSYGMATVAKNLKIGAGDEILVMDEQFPSNVYPWQPLIKEKGVQIKTIKAPDSLQERGKKWNEALLESISSKTKLVAIGHVHWADGTKFDLHELRKRTRDVGAALVIDGTQSVGALPFDVQEIEPDALIVAAYKWMMGPYSIGMAYYSDYFDDGNPLENSWIARKGSEDFSQLVHYQDHYKTGAARYEVGESANFILTSMLTRAIDQLLEWTPEAIQDYCHEICTDAQALLVSRGYWVEEPKYRGNHLFGIRLPDSVQLQVVKERILSEKIHVSIRGQVIRVSPHVYNKKEDVEKLVHVILNG